MMMFGGVTQIPIKVPTTANRLKSRPGGRAARQNISGTRSFFLPGSRICESGFWFRQTVYPVTDFFCFERPPWRTVQPFRAEAEA
jgi:hypothetical protein